MNSSVRFFPVLLTLLLMMVCPAVAQEAGTSAAGSSRETKTIIQIELLSSRFGGPLVSQEWGRLFEKLGVVARIRQPVFDEEPEIKESVRGTLRLVKLIGQIDRDGSVVFPGHRFRQSEMDELREWLEELRTYGAQGAPTGKPLWGLQRAQFTEIFDSLKSPIEVELKGRPVEEALAELPLPATYPVRWHTSTEAIRETAGSVNVLQEVRGLSAGTGLSAILADLGLGYRPLRTPSGSIELVIQKLSDAPDAWPVGWEPLEGTSRLQLAPTLFQMERVGFDQVPLAEILDAIETATGVPIIIDYGQCRTHDIDPHELRVSYPTKRTAWALLVNSVVRQARLTKEFKVDEAGHTFLHVYPFVPKAATER
ncbi:hypothetical protein Mal4_30980 [Maioricimonas rarisocia]|uniref:Uncharacterized protein n=1 Tax=Maioricimonas rarisocia TaxID=2528026 RepID=A0A517Z8G3_9PLAN|nr:hypothetical protein [Maioricimonas rarisocia]QDU38768.1 hypothetical protein Mal4_30980 [Maioricimonas rarisocia]